MKAGATADDERVQDLIDRFWETFPAVWNQIRGHIRSNATQRFDVTVEQFHVLRHIRRGISSVSELADVKQISRPAVSQAVDTLVERGFVSRRRSTQDRRYVQLELTPAGDELLDAIFCSNRQWMASKLSSLTEQDINGILSALELLNHAFEEQPVG